MSPHTSQVSGGFNFMKQCSKCKKILPDNYFDKRGKEDYLASKCKKCFKKYHKLWREKNKEKWNNYNKKYIGRKKSRPINQKAEQDRKIRCRATNNRWYQRNKEKIRIQQKQYRQENREKMNACNRRWREKVRKEVLSYYSNRTMKCACCGENHIEFLSIDHIKGGGRKHRKARKIGSMCFWLKSNHYPKGYQVLCHNCNQSKGCYGYCPHQKLNSNV